MKIEGKFIKALQKVEGETERGPWVRGGFVIESFGEYPRKVAFTLFGEDKVKMTDGLKEGQPVDVYFQPESREWGDKWFTDLKATNVRPMSAAAPATAPAPQAQYPYAAQAVQTPTTPYLAPEPVQQTMQMPAEADEDLPF